MADKYIKDNGGYFQEVEGQVTGGTVTEAGMLPALDNTGRLSTTIMPVGIGPLVKTIKAYEGLNAGDFVNIFYDSTLGNTGVKVRKADASDINKKADGYVVSVYSADDMAIVYFEDFNDQITAVATDGGKDVYLSAVTPGGITFTAPVGPNMVQLLGQITGVNSMSVEIEKPTKKV